MSKMGTNLLTPARRRELKAQAHHLKPVVRVGQKGISENLINETDQALQAHELIKVHIACDDRQERRMLAEQLARACEAELIGHIGKISILYRAKETS